MKIIFLLSAFILLSCANQNQTNNPTTSTDMESSNDGFTEMTIVESKNTSCEFILQDKENNLYEVESITNKIPMLKAKKQIAIKFTHLKKMSVCDAQPIVIDEIRKEK